MFKIWQLIKSSILVLPHAKIISILYVIWVKGHFLSFSWDFELPVWGTTHLWNWPCRGTKHNAVPPKRGVTKHFWKLEEKDYWNRLQFFNLERHIIIYVWKTQEKLVPNLTTEENRIKSVSYPPDEMVDSAPSLLSLRETLDYTVCDCLNAYHRSNSGIWQASFEK